MAIRGVYSKIAEVSIYKSTVNKSGRLSSQKWTVCSQKWTIMFTKVDSLFTKVDDYVHESERLSSLKWMTKFPKVDD